MSILSPDLTVTNEMETTSTYQLTDSKIQGFTDGIKALEQAVYKMLNTEKYEYPIYSFSYGIALESLIGKNPVYVKLALKRHIRECLLQDERVESVDNFEFSVTEDTMLCTFDVVSIYGEIKISLQIKSQ